MHELYYSGTIMLCAVYFGWWYVCPLHRGFNNTLAILSLKISYVV